VAKLDRLTRSVRHFDDLRVWADEHGKTIASVASSTGCMPGVAGWSMPC
jgi:DNA invertase Pin-like site-specific DNA recombinase